MPLAGSEAVLAAAIKARLDTEFPIDPSFGIDEDDRQKFAEAIAETVLIHLVAQPLSVFGIAPPGTSGGPITGGKLL